MRNLTLIIRLRTGTPICYDNEHLEFRLNDILLLYPKLTKNNTVTTGKAWKIDSLNQLLK